LRQFLIDEGAKFLPPMPQNAAAKAATVAPGAAGGRKRKVRKHAD
jgi:hypothetical protein